MKKILFISYYFTPDKSVASKRMSYWAEHLKSQIKEKVELDVVTATDIQEANFDSIDNVYYVPDNKRGILNSVFKTDKGSSWFYALKFFFKHINNKQYDSVIISGNPFLHFFIAHHFKRSMNAQVILDFRDPFARNSRVITSDIRIKFKKKLLELVEYYFCCLADNIIVPNVFCKDLLCSLNKKKVSIIDNGYDESQLDIVEPIYGFNNSKRTLVYLGTTAKDRHMRYLECANEQIGNVFNLLHVGRKTSEIMSSQCNKVKSTGLISYEEAIAYTKGCDVGVLLATGTLFESSSKVFDYIGMDLPILIITNGEIKVGNVHELTKRHPLVWWCKNNTQDIVGALKKIEDSSLESNTDCGRSSHSRKAGLIKLVDYCEL